MWGRQGDCDDGGIPCGGGSEGVLCMYYWQDVSNRCMHTRIT